MAELTYSVGTSDDNVVPILYRNTTSLCRRTATFVTSSDNQTSALIEVYRGERVLAEKN